MTSTPLPKKKKNSNSHVPAALARSTIGAQLSFIISESLAISVNPMPLRYHSAAEAGFMNHNSGLRKKV